ncbi:YbjN domain-containing protein [Corynebacterium sp.]|uniref:YbjN domain-containing protein n=1 Tax=Corynebacterium sp. TaxID=1720 RepID=UPI0026DDC980|nr:YbjN domain-containing protein [Corynebacterium sp.]MDO5031506.1 YbjN domain-containing protein [Corynebacterium sp.]
MSSTDNALASEQAAEIHPVTIHRLVEVFELLDAEYVIVDKPAEDADEPQLVLQTGIPHVSIHLDIEEDILSAFATWQARLPASAEDEISLTLSQFNWESVAPTLSYLVEEGAKGNEEILVGANRAMAVGEGMSQQQLAAFVLSAFDSFGEIFDALAQHYPQAAPWAAGNAADSEEN